MKIGRFKPIMPGFDQLHPGNRRNEFTLLRLTAEHIITSLPCPSFPCLFWNSLFVWPCEKFLVSVSVERFPLLFQGF